MGPGPRAKPCALVTGAGRRVGRALAVALAQAGHPVVVHHHASVEGARDCLAEIAAAGGVAHALSADLTDQDAVEALIPRAAALVGPLGVLVNSASLFEHDTWDSLDPDRFDRQMAVNLKAPAFLARAFARQVPDGPPAVIINVLDNKVAALDPDFLSYGLTKVALEGLTRMLAQALAPRVRVNGLAPGLTLPSGRQTPESFAAAAARAPLGRSSSLADLGQALLYLVDAKAMTGQTLVVDGGAALAGPACGALYKSAAGDG